LSKKINSSNYNNLLQKKDKANKDGIDDTLTHWKNNY
jgi:hypothetical protein